MSAGTIIVGLILIAIIALAIRHVRTKGSCACGDCAQSCNGSCCESTDNFDKLLKDIEKQHQ